MTQAEQIAYLCDQIDELSARARRTETLLHKVREHLGVPSLNPCTAESATLVVAHGHDVTLSQIKKALEEKMYALPDCPVLVAVRGDVIASIEFL